MAELATILRKMKIKRGYLDFDVDEAKILVNENGKPTDVVLRERSVGENLIEDLLDEKVTDLLSKYESEKLNRILATSNRLDPCIKDGVYQLKSALDETKVLTLADSSDNSKVPFRLWSNRHSDSQKFEIKYKNGKNKCR